MTRKAPRQAHLIICEAGIRSSCTVRTTRVWTKPASMLGVLTQHSAYTLDVLEHAAEHWTPIRRPVCASSRCGAQPR